MDANESTSIPSELEDQLWALLARPRADRELAIEELCGAHASHAASIRRFFEELGSLNAPSDTDVEAEPALAPGDRIGPYHLVRLLGQGGFGVVFLAERREPVLQKVALKLIKLGMDSRAIVQRFERERRSLARMQHDAIAKVYDCGTTERGQPYFVMEYIEGQPLAHYCRQRRLSISDRLRLFQKVCAGVQHAHSKSVVHRDLKPDNILVAEIDGQPSPKIIDFGLAKVLEERDRVSLQLSRNVRLGTPAYMAPEQADPSNEDIDTRADVYALGVILYELLVGELPHAPGDAQRLLARAFAELETPRPSRKLPMGNARTQAIAKECQTSAKALRRVLEQDLDWVVLKAMAKLPADRYPTPLSLSDELQRFLDDEPLHAGPPSWSYRCRKWLRRYRGPVLAVALVLFVLLGGIIAAYAGFDRARRQQGIAEQAQYETTRLLEQKVRDNAQLALSQARLAVERGLFELVADQPPIEQSSISGSSSLERVESALLRIEALDALGRSREAYAAIREIEDNAKGTKLEARTLLLVGQTVHGRSSAGGRKAFQRALELATEDPQQLEDVDRIFAEAMLAKDLLEAERFLRKCLELRPRHVAALEALGPILLARGMAPESIAIAELWMTLAPRNLNATMLRFLAEALADHEEEARPFLRQLKERAPSYASFFEVVVEFLQQLHAVQFYMVQCSLSTIADAIPGPIALEGSRRGLKIDPGRLQTAAQEAVKLIKKLVRSENHSVVDGLRLPPPLRDLYSGFATDARLLLGVATGVGEGANFPEQYIALNRIVMREGIDSPNRRSALEVKGFTSNGRGALDFLNVLDFVDSAVALRRSEEANRDREDEASESIRKHGAALLECSRLTEADLRDILSIVINLGCYGRWMFAENTLSLWRSRFSETPDWNLCRAEILYARGLESEAIQQIDLLERAGNERARLLRQRWAK